MLQELSYRVQGTWYNCRAASSIDYACDFGNLLAAQERGVKEFEQEFGWGFDSQDNMRHVWFCNVLFCQC